MSTNLLPTISALLLLLSFQVAQAQQADQFVTAMNSQWSAKNYTSLETTIETALTSRPDDVTVLYAAFNFYLMVKPNLTKLTSTINKIKVVAEAVKKPALTAVSDEMQEKLPGLTSEGLGTPTDATLSELHKSFPDEFPLISFGARLQASRNK